MKNKKAFTLTEMLVVIIIISILAGIATTSIIFLRNKAKDKYYKSLEENIKLASSNYLVDNKTLIANTLKYAGDQYTLKISDLLSTAKLSDISDFNGKSCAYNNNSVVYITKEAINKYSYNVCMICNDYTSSNSCEQNRNEVVYEWSAEDTYLYYKRSYTNSEIFKKLGKAKVKVTPKVGDPFYLYGTPSESDTSSDIYSINEINTNVTLDALSKNNYNDNKITYIGSEDIPINKRTYTKNVNVYQNKAPRVKYKKKSNATYISIVDGSEITSDSEIDIKILPFVPGATKPSIKKINITRDETFNNKDSCDLITGICTNVFFNVNKAENRVEFSYDSGEHTIYVNEIDTEGNASEATYFKYKIVDYALEIKLFSNDLDISHDQNGLKSGGNVITYEPTGITVENDYWINASDMDKIGNLKYKYLINDSNTCIFDSCSLTYNNGTQENKTFYESEIFPDQNISLIEGENSFLSQLTTSSDKHVERNDKFYVDTSIPNIGEITYEDTANEKYNISVNMSDNNGIRGFIYSETSNLEEFNEVLKHIIPQLKSYNQENDEFFDINYEIYSIDNVMHNTNDRIEGLSYDEEYSIWAIDQAGNISRVQNVYRDFKSPSCSILVNGTSTTGQADYNTWYYGDSGVSLTLSKAKGTGNITNYYIGTNNITNSSSNIDSMIYKTNTFNYNNNIINRYYQTIYGYVKDSNGRTGECSANIRFDNSTPELYLKEVQVGGVAGKYKVTQREVLNSGMVGYNLIYLQNVCLDLPYINLGDSISYFSNLYQYIGIVPTGILSGNYNSNPTSISIDWPSDDDERDKCVDVGGQYINGSCVCGTTICGFCTAGSTLFYEYTSPVGKKALPFMLSFVKNWNDNNCKNYNPASYYNEYYNINCTNNIVLNDIDFGTVSTLKWQDR